MRQRIQFCAFLCFIVCLLSGCGVKGSLYLPTKESPQNVKPVLKDASMQSDEQRALTE